MNRMVDSDFVFQYLENHSHEKNILDRIKSEIFEKENEMFFLVTRVTKMSLKSNGSAAEGCTLSFLVTHILVIMLILVTFWLRFGYNFNDLVTIWLRNP